MPKLFVSTLTLSHASGVPSLSQIPNISSMNLLKMSGYVQYFGMRVMISWQAKYIVAHIHAADVPIAVPIAVPKSWRKCILPHSNRLFLITISIASLTASNGKPSGRSLLRVSRHMLIILMAWWVQMFVYMELASAVKILAPGGSSPSFCSCFSSWELSRI